MVNVGINGFGRIGRLAFRIALTKHKGNIRLAAINTSGSMNVSGWTHLAQYDTMYRKFEKELHCEEVKDRKEATDEDPLIGYIKVDGESIPVTAQRDPGKIPWSKYGADVIIESTGVFRTEEEAKKHASGGAKRVVISAPAKGGNVDTLVLGVNDPPSRKASEGQEMTDPMVISNASCTTNCVAPVMSVIQSAFGIEKALMTTIHGYTDDQNLQDGSHKDLRRARAAAQNIVPTTTGAAIATTETIPELKDKFDGRALRVPVTTGSITDFTFLLSQNTNVAEVNNVLKDAAENNAIYKGILAVTEEPLVSSDIIGRSESSIVDLELTQVVGGNLVKVFAWYDNEWGYANRLVEQVIRVGERLDSDKAPKDPITLSHGQSRD
ncbi:type I glyceraldehyde-3-phosphate dehydrogenase [Candidatus Woesebacteria bacterium]|nr:type I glyceraldehyde-3-phosphate dehydrogenase [Candidatus Woesebacteria bacterium]